MRIDEHEHVNLEIESGRIEVADNTWTVVTFAEEFRSVPNVFLTMEDEVGVIENLSLRNILTTGFEIHQELKTAATKWIQWIATK